MRTVPEYLLADDITGKRFFLIHTAAPAYVAEIFGEEDMPLDVGVTYGCADGRSLAVLNWIGDEPSETAYRETMAAAEKYLQEYDAQTDALEDEEEE